MTTLGWILVLAGILYFRGLARGRSFTEIPQDFAELLNHVIQWDFDAAQEVLTRSGENTNTTATYPEIQLASGFDEGSYAGEGTGGGGGGGWDDVSATASAFIAPLKGKITDLWGVPRAGYAHAGIDIAAPTGTPVKAASSGTVIGVGTAGSGLTSGRTGTYILIEHANGSATYYGHLNSVAVRSGQSVTTGQTIGTVGTTGNVTGPHLHFEYRPDASSSKTANPSNYVPILG